ncbi:hypothetical protein SBV1_1020019 [Verrucomicrobia bacterium]|nr:hypothetical protein SBV1_1020019 [Verrucomicrobiota bacterium]
MLAVQLRSAQCGGRRGIGRRHTIAGACRRFGTPLAFESGSKLHALYTLREVGYPGVTRHAGILFELRLDGYTSQPGRYSRRT